eukprot:505874_1
MCKTTNTIYQLRNLIASALQNIDPNKLQIAHRGQVLNNMDLTLSQCDIAQYDTIIAKIDTHQIQEDILSSHASSRIHSPRCMVINSPRRPQSVGSTHSDNAGMVTPSPIELNHNNNNNNNRHHTRGSIHGANRVGKKLWTPGKTPHSCSSLNTSSTHQTPRSRKRRSQIRKSQIFSTGNGILPGLQSPPLNKDNLSDDSYMSYPLSPPISHTNDNKEIIKELNNLSNTNMSIVANKIGAMYANKIGTMK